MPSNTEDNYWGATEKELASKKGSLQYCSWLICGGKKPSFIEDNIRNVYPTVTGRWRGVNIAADGSLRSNGVITSEQYQRMYSQLRHIGTLDIENSQTPRRVRRVRP